MRAMHTLLCVAQCVAHFYRHNRLPTSCSASTEWFVRLAVNLAHSVLLCVCGGVLLADCCRLAQDATFEMERRRNRPEKYDRELAHKTVKAMEKITEVCLLRLRRFAALLLGAAARATHHSPGRSTAFPCSSVVESTLQAQLCLLLMPARLANQDLVPQRSRQYFVTAHLQASAVLFSAAAGHKPQSPWRRCVLSSTAVGRVQVRQKRQERFWEARMRKARQQQRTADVVSLEKEIHLVRAPGAMSAEAAAGKATAAKEKKKEKKKERLRVAVEPAAVPQAMQE